MRPQVSRSLRTSLNWIVLISLTHVVTPVDSVAQGILGLRPPGVARMSRERSSRGLSQTAPQTALGSPFPTWTQVFPAINDYDSPPFRGAHSAVYDPGSNTMIVYGGADGNLALSSNVLIDTNANGSGGVFAGAWSDLIVSGVFPPPRANHTAVYDQTNNRMIVFAGCGDPFCTFLPLNDTWVLTHANGLGGTPAWIELSPSGTLPNPRMYHNAVYDAANNRMIVFSGDNQVAAFSDVWVLTNANGLGGTPAWTQVSPTGGPPDAFDSSTAVYDPVSNTMIVFGGGAFVNSVWTLSHANGLGGIPAWTNLIANGKTGSPPGRIDAKAIYDSASNRMTIYGGNSGGGTISPDFDYVALGDVWVLANANGLGGTPAWTQLHPKVAGDGAILPIGRDYFSAVRDPGTNSMIILGGDTTEGIYLSTWALSHANGL